MLKFFYIIRCYCLAILILMMCFCTNNHTIISKAAEIEETEENFSSDFPYIMTINTLEYPGFYNGETVDGVPDGKGKFTTSEECFIQFVYEGKFSEGKFHGKGTVTLKDGLYFKGSFKKGVPNGSGKIYYPDGTYRNIRYTNGVPYGITDTYSADSELIDYDFYYNGETINSLKQVAKSIDYRELYLNPNKYYGDVFKITATVTEVYENKSSCFFKIQDEDQHFYWGQYTNTRHKKYNQAIMPTLEVGDQLELYAFFIGVTGYDSFYEPVGAYELLPQLCLITGITDDFSIDYNNLSYRYDEVLKYPFNYYKKKNKMVATVDKLFLNGDATYYKIFDKDHNYYYLLLDEVNDKILPIHGDTISFEGTYCGLFKEYSSENVSDATLFVYLESDSVEIL